jgi:hypothetical protein
LSNAPFHFLLSLTLEQVDDVLTPCKERRRQQNNQQSVQCKGGTPVTQAILHGICPILLSIIFYVAVMFFLETGPFSLSEGLFES